MSLLSRHLPLYLPAMLNPAIPSLGLSKGFTLIELLFVVMVSPPSVSPRVSWVPPPFIWSAEFADVSESLLATDSFGGWRDSSGQLSMFAALPGNPSSVPSTHVR